MIHQHLSSVQHDNQGLLSEEERLKKEVEDIKRRIEEFNRITALELIETESVKRGQIRSRQKERVMKEETGSQKELTALEQQQQEQLLSDLERSTSMEKVRRKPKAIRSPKASRKSSPKARQSSPSPEKQKMKKKSPQKSKSPDKKKGSPTNGRGRTKKQKGSKSPTSRGNLGSAGITVLDNNEGPKFIGKKLQEKIKDKKRGESVEEAIGWFEEQKGHPRPSTQTFNATATSRSKERGRPKGSEWFKSKNETAGAIPLGSWVNEWEESGKQGSVPNKLSKKKMTGRTKSLSKQ